MAFDTLPPGPNTTQSTKTNPIAAVRMLSFMIIIAGAAFLGGVYFSEVTDSPHNDSDFDLFWQSWDILEDEYYYELPENKKLIYGSIQGLMYTAGDRYTFFVPPVEAEIDRQTTAGEFGGIGAYVSVKRGGFIVIVDPFPNLPAEKAGLQPDDIILAVNNTSLDGMAFEDALTLLRGEIGTKVELTIYRASEENTFSVEITREKVELPTAFSRMYGNIGYVRLFHFNAVARTALEREILSLLENDPQGLILDLRGNPGGLLDQAVTVSDLFLPEGVVVTQKPRKGDTIVYRSSSGDVAEDIPLVVLINGSSASASEVVAGALHDHNRATLVGETSFGKGSVQHVHDLKDNSQLHVTVAIWLTPNGTPIDGQGLEPDILVENPDAADTDPFIDAALAFFEGEAAPDSPDNQAVQPD